MRLDRIIRCFQVIEALSTRRGKATKELRDVLGCSLKTAYRYIDAASCVFVVSESGYPKRFKINEPIGNFNRPDFEKSKSHRRRIARGIYFALRS